MLQGGELTMLAIPEGRGRRARAEVQSAIKNAQWLRPQRPRFARLLEPHRHGPRYRPEGRPRSFKRSSRPKADGSGLGLPTTKKIIEAHRGDIAGESEVGHGTKFTIRLRAPPFR